VEHAAVAKQIDAPQNLALIQTCTAPLVPLALHVSDLRTMPTLTRSVDAVHSLLMEPFTSCLGCASITLALKWPHIPALSKSALSAARFTGV
jgi:hypothetical protein